MQSAVAFTVPFDSYNSGSGWGVGEGWLLSSFYTGRTHTGSSSCKESTCNAGEAGNEGLIPGSGKSPEGGNGNPLQYSCLENLMDRGAWWATVHGVKKSWTWLKWLRTHPGRKLSCPAWDLSFLVPNPLFLPPLCAFWPTITEALTLQVWNQLDITPGQSISNWGKDS